MSSVVIPVGYNCNVTMLMQQLQIKKETTLFEWFESCNLQAITDVINSIKTDIDTNIIGGENNTVFLINRKIYSNHYTVEGFKPIFIRRATRFLDTLKNTTDVIFTRINVVGRYTTESELVNFCSAIHSINSDLKITFLLIDIVKTEDQNKPLSIDKLSPSIRLFQRHFLVDDCKDRWLRNEPIVHNIFYNYLLEAGYIPSVKCDKKFTDKD